MVNLYHCSFCIFGNRVGRRYRYVLEIGVIPFLESLLLIATDTFQLGKLQILAEIFPEPSSLPSTEFFSSTLFWYFF